MVTMDQAEWTRISQTEAFGRLASAKRRFVVSAMVFFVVFYFAMPLLIGLTSVLQNEAIGAVNLAYLYAYAQFLMILVLGHLYLARAKRWDQLVEQTKRDAAHKGVRAE